MGVHQQGEARAGRRIGLFTETVTAEEVERQQPR